MEEKIVYDKEYAKEYIEIDTGEVKTLGQITFDDWYRRKQAEEESLGKKKLTDKQIEGLKKKKSKDLLHQALDFYCGSYYFNNYDKLIKKLEDNMLFRFMYICSSMDYENRVKVGAGDSSFMTLNDFQSILNISKTESFNTMKSFVKNGVITDKEGIIYINKRFCVKGKMPKSYERKCVRVFDTAIKYLYENSKPSEHSKLGLLIKLLPHINKQHNVICFNPDEENETLINCMSMSQLCDAIGYSKSNSSRLKKDLLGLRVNEQLVIMINETDYGKFITVNPVVYYGGSNSLDDLESVIKLFRIKGTK